MFTNEDNNNVVLAFLASIMAANGLTNGDIAAVICSMLVAPYLGNIVEMGEGLVNKTSISYNATVVLTYMGVSLLVGILYNLIRKNINAPDKDNSKIKAELINKSKIGLWKIISLAIFSIVSAVTLAYMKNRGYSDIVYTVVLVGVAIGVSLLPPTVRAGMLLSEGECKHGFNSLMQTIVTAGGLIAGTYGFLVWG